jgi:hypothetical protein
MAFPMMNANPKTVGPPLENVIAVAVDIKNAIADGNTPKNSQFSCRFLTYRMVPSLSVARTGQYGTVVGTIS